MDEAERRKFDLDDSMEEEEERYDRFGGAGGGGNILPPAYHVHRGHAGEEMDVYLDDDMESQRDGSVISRTAIYVWGRRGRMETAKAEDKERRCGGGSGASEPAPFTSKQISITSIS